MIGGAFKEPTIATDGCVRTSPVPRHLSVLKSLQLLVVELELVNGEETLKVCCPLVGIQNQRPKRPEVGRNIERDRCLENREAYVAILARAAPL